MYSVSADYLTALAQPVHKYRLSGTVGTEAFDQSNIISGSLSITNKVSEGSEIKLGSVYTGELRATFTGLSIARGSWVGKKITLSEGLQLADESFEDVPLGVFTIAEATHKADGVSVVAYDAMTAFDKARNDLTETGTAYDFLSLMCQKCGVTLGMTSADVAALTNGTETLSVYSENDIETWRDLLSWVAQTLCSVATINRAGELELRQYSISSAATIDETHRFTGCSFSDFTTYYTGMSVVNIALRQTEYKSVTPDDGLTYNLGSNPLVQGDYELVQNIIDEFSDVQLVPFSAQMLGGAIYDLCDCLTFSGGIAAGAVCGVMGYTWKYNGAYAVNGFGSNPALATAKSKAQKDIDAIYNTIGEEINQMSVVQNSSSVTCGESTETSILTYNFEVTQEENTTMVDVSVVIDSHARESLVNDVYTLSDVVANLSFYVDDSEVGVYSPRFIVDEGNDTITFNYSLSGLSVGAHEFDVRLTMNGAYGIVGAGNAHELLWGYGITFEVYVKSIEVTTLPTTTTFYAGQRLNYAGLEVSEVYNNGIKNDVTDSCSLYPAEGTVLTSDDVGTLTVDVDYDSFSADFDLNVELLGFDFNLSEDTLPTFDYSTDTIFFKVGSALYVTNSYIKSNSSYNYAKIVYALLAVGNDGSVTIQNSGAVQKDFAMGQLNTRTINGIARIGTRFYIPGSSSYQIDGTFFEMKYVDVSDGSSGNMSVSYVYLADESATLYSFRLASSSFFVVDGYIIFPYIRCTLDNGGTYTQHESMAWVDVSGNAATVYILDPSLWTYDHYYSEIDHGTTNRLFNQPCYVVYDNGDISVYDMECDQSGLSCYHKSTFSTGFTSTPTRKRVKNANKYVFYQFVSTSPYIVLTVGVYDYDTDTYSGEWTVSEEDSIDIVQMIMGTSDQFERVAWSEEKGLYLYPISSYPASYQKQIVYASGDFETWIKTTCDSTYYEGSMPASFSYSDGIIVGGFTAQTQTYTYTPATLTYKVD